MKTLSLFALVLPAVVALTGCSSDTTGGGTSVLAGSGQTIVAGSIEREKKPTAFNEEVAIAADAHVVIALRTYRGADAEAPLFVEVDRPFRGFPIDFSIAGDGQAAFANRAELLVEAIVYNHAGRDQAVGDMGNEERASVAREGEHLALRVSGLEQCGKPGAGGFCVGSE